MAAFRIQPPPPPWSETDISSADSHQLALSKPRCVTQRAAGGSAANVAKSLAHLRPAAGVSFVSQVGTDGAGQEYRQGLADAGVRPVLLQSRTGLPTSTCLCLVRELSPPWLVNSAHARSKPLRRDFVHRARETVDTPSQDN